MSDSGYKVGGFEARFVIERTDGKPCNPLARYMVLNLGVDESGGAFDPVARAVAAEYAVRVRPINPALADDLERMLREGFPVAVAQHKDAR